MLSYVAAMKKIAPLVDGRMGAANGSMFKGTRCGGLRVGLSEAAPVVGGAELAKAGDLALVEGVFWELLRKADEDGFALLDAAVAELADG
jgi:hypothetical protein